MQRAINACTIKVASILANTKAASIDRVDSFQQPSHVDGHPILLCSIDKEEIDMQIHKNLKRVVALATATCIAASALASEQVLPPGSFPCEVDWINRSDFSALDSIALLEFLERKAELGNLAVQLRLGLVRKTNDGKWIASADRSYNIKWLEKAQAQGSKSAAWELARLEFRPPPFRKITHEAFLKSTMAAAEEEANPWAASYLMNLTNGRYGLKSKPTSCAEEWTPDGKCAPPELLPISSARKWAEIAAEGGNAQAQEWLCKAALDGNPDRGQPKDEKAALKWCQIAVYNACTFWSVGWLGTLINNGVDGTPLNESEANRLKKTQLQPWRIPSGYFFPPANPKK